MPNYYSCVLQDCLVMQPYSIANTLRSSHVLSRDYLNGEQVWDDYASNAFAGCLSTRRRCQSHGCRFVLLR